MAGQAYLCEAAGNRIFKWGVGLTRVGGTYNAELDTWDLTPMGQSGVCAFRAVQVAGRMTNGLVLGVTPVVDGVAQVEQLFGFAGAGEWSVTAFLNLRGARLAARIRTVGLTGDVEFHDVAGAFVPLRSVP